MKAYVATGEKVQLVCSYDKSASKALKSVAKKIDSMGNEDEWLMLNGINVSYDDDGYYGIVASVSVSKYF